MENQRVSIHNGRPSRFVSLYWINDLKKFGVMVHQLYNPFTKALGLEFLKGKKRKSVTFGPEDPGELAVAKAVWSVEQEFGIPKEGSPYYKILSMQGGG